MSIFARHSASESLTLAHDDSNAAYDKFVLEYAQMDDHIRRLWLQLQQEQQKLLVSTNITVPGRAVSLLYL